MGCGTQIDRSNRQPSLIYTSINNVASNLTELNFKRYGYCPFCCLYDENNNFYQWFRISSRINYLHVQNRILFYTQSFSFKKCFYAIYYFSYFLYFFSLERSVQNPTNTQNPTNQDTLKYTTKNNMKIPNSDTNRVK